MKNKLLNILGLRILTTTTTTTTTTTPISQISFSRNDEKVKNLNSQKIYNVIKEEDIFGFIQKLSNNSNSEYYHSTENKNSVYIPVNQKNRKNENLQLEIPELEFYGERQWKLLIRTYKCKVKQNAFKISFWRESLKNVKSFA